MSAQLKENVDNKIDLKSYVQQIGRDARAASRQIAKSGTAMKNAALEAIADQIMTAQQNILDANAQDMTAAKNNQLSSALLDRLELNAERVAAMAEGLRQIARLPDPVGAISDLVYRPSGIQVGKMRVPLGVIGIIYESRPNVTADAAALCLKSGNATVLRGGSEAINSNLAIADCIKQGLEKAGLPSTSVQVLEITDREAVGELLRMPQYVDIIVPRGGKSLIERISSDSQVPVIKHLEGLCHIYIDDDADVQKAIDVAYNAKTRRYGICGSMETLLVAESIAPKVLPELSKMYLDKGVELRGCEKSRALIEQMSPATEDDWYTEYLGPILSIKIVDDLDAAIRHIETYGSQHTDAIVTENLTHSRRFVTEVDSSSVMVNASTQFADGFEYGLGAEIGISTNKLHVRGPVGLEGLTCQKYVVFGDGTIRP